jgi:hypothetical protein
MINPMIYCNGDSYSNPEHHPLLTNKTYDHVVGEYLQGYVMNRAISGSCNRRIIRTTVHDMIQQRRLNPQQKTIALIGLTFELRSELWIDDRLPDRPEESHFGTHVFSRQLNWRENLLQGLSIGTPNWHQLEKKYFDKYSQGRAYFYSPYAERINLFCDLIMLKSMLDRLNIDFLVFNCVVPEQLESDYLLDFFQDEIVADPRFIDLNDFGFLRWSHLQGFVPLDFLDNRPELVHFNADAHRAFAEQVILPKIKELNLI